jgi:FSR family fosmidomycin resistance protein-like MFS transporter
MAESRPISPAAPHRAAATVMPILLALSVSHLLNDTIQSLIPAIYPILKSSFDLTFTQIGLITLTFQITASLLQPVVGFYTDRTPRPYSLTVGMGFTLVGLILLSRAPTYHWILVSAGLVGIGSSVFHPEASRMARAASGGQPGLAQSIFQVGGNFGSSLGPLLAAAIIVPHGQRSIVWFSAIALLGMIVLFKVGRWYSGMLERRKGKTGAHGHPPHGLSAAKVGWSITILLALIFSKYFYLASLTSYYTFYLIHQFGASVQVSQVCLFVFLLAVAAGTILGGPLGDRFGRKYVIWGSILGVAPFTLILPHVGFAMTVALTIVIGVILASAFSAILVYAQDLIPGKVGTVAGLFFGFAFGMGGVASAVLGKLADRSGIVEVFRLCAFLPLIGLLTAFLPNLQGKIADRR